jgi:hypothetical protein
MLDQGALKAEIENSLSQADGYILTNDLKNLTYSTKSGEELDLVIKAIQKYETQSSALGKLKYHFETPLMLLFYIHNETDKALELFMSNVNATHT